MGLFLFQLFKASGLLSFVSYELRIRFMLTSNLSFSVAHLALQLVYLRFLVLNLVVNSLDSLCVVLFVELRFLLLPLGPHGIFK